MAQTISVFQMAMTPIRIMIAMIIFMFAAIGKLFGLAKWSHKQGKIIAAATNRELQCSQGCEPQPADGSWVCSSCNAVRSGWAWDKCPVCGTAASYIPCSTCGHAIVSPKN